MSNFPIDHVQTNKSPITPSWQERMSSVNWRAYWQAVDSGDASEANRIKIENCKQTAIHVKEYEEELILRGWQVKSKKNEQV